MCQLLFTPRVSLATSEHYFTSQLSTSIILTKSWLGHGSATQRHHFLRYLFHWYFIGKSKFIESGKTNKLLSLDKLFRIVEQDVKIIFWHRTSDNAAILNIESGTLVQLNQVY